MKRFLTLKTQITFSFVYIDTHFLIILQVTFGVKWLRFIFQYSLYSSLYSLYMWFSRMNDFLWLLNLYLKSVSVVAM